MTTRSSKIFRRRPPLVWRSLLLAAILCTPVFSSNTAIYAGQSATAPSGQGLKPILDYISSAWDTLTRSMTDCQSVVDPKIKAVPVLYLPAGFAEPPAVQKLAADCGVRIEHLPIEIHHLGEI